MLFFKILKHIPIILYSLFVGVIVFLLIYTNYAIRIPYSIPMTIGIAGAILAYYLSLRKAKRNVLNSYKKIAVAEPPTPYYANLYFMEKNFTGRETERKELTNWFLNDSCSVFASIAIGGMGKSALAWYWLQEEVIKQGLAHEGIFWWSFYDEEAGFESFLDHALNYTSRGDVNAKNIESTRDKINKLYSFLNDKQYLFILDGVERVLKAYAGLGSPYQGDVVNADEKEDYRMCIDPNCGTFLKMLTSVSKSKTLITSRLYPKELDDLTGCLRKDLEEMDKDDAEEFFRKQGVNGTRAEIEEVCQAYGSHPLSLRLLTGMIVHDMKYGGDIKIWKKYNPLIELAPREHNILELAYNSLEKKKRNFISRFAAFRSAMDYNALSIFNDFSSECKFNDVLLELINRGMLFRDEMGNKFDLHPIVRKYCYDRLKGKKGVHSKLIDYFEEVPKPENIESLDDLAPIIELYHHTVRAGRNDQAVVLFRDRLVKPLHYEFGVHNLIIELLSALFPDGEDKLPRLKNKSAQTWVMNTLAISYSLSGQSRRALPLKKIVVHLEENDRNEKNFITSLCNLALEEIRIGELDAAKENLLKAIKICEENNVKFEQIQCSTAYGSLLTSMGSYKNANKQFDEAYKLANEVGTTQQKLLIDAYRSICSLFMNNADEALKFAMKVYNIALNRQNERDKIMSFLLLGSAQNMKGNIAEAGTHLKEALIRSRKVNMVDLELETLFEFAKLQFKGNSKEEASTFAKKALLIADRCEYRLKQADIHNFLAEFYLDAGDLKNAKEHGKMAKDAAECSYIHALEKAEKLLKAIEQRK